MFCELARKFVILIATSLRPNLFNLPCNSFARLGIDSFVIGGGNAGILNCSSVIPRSAICSAVRTVDILAL